MLQPQSRFLHDTLLRELVDGQGLAGYDLQLTPEGRELAEAWEAI